MALLDVIKHDNPDDGWFVWKYPSETLAWGSQLVVGEGQQALFVKGGQLCDVFHSGTHTLSSGNIPILENLINLPFGGDTPFTAEIWFVNTTVKRDLRWGTPSPIQLFDPALRLPVSVRGFGKWGVRIYDPISFLRQIVGTQDLGDSDRVREYFIGKLTQSLTQVLSEEVTSGARSVLNISNNLNSLSVRSRTMLIEELENFGVELINLDIESLNIPQEEIEKIQETYNKAFEARELSTVQTGGAFAQIKSFEVLGDAAQNQGDGTVGALLGAGIGLGAGLPLGSQMANQMELGSKSNDRTTTEKLAELKQMFDQGLISEEQYQNKQNALLEDL